MIHYQKCINKYSNWLLIKCLALSKVSHSQECNNNILLIGLMAVCEEYIRYHQVLRSKPSLCDCGMVFNMW